MGQSARNHMGNCKAGGILHFAGSIDGSEIVAHPRWGIILRWSIGLLFCGLFVLAKPVYAQEPYPAEMWVFLGQNSCVSYNGQTPDYVVPVGQCFDHHQEIASAESQDLDYFRLCPAALVLGQTNPTTETMLLSWSYSAQTSARRYSRMEFRFFDYEYDSGGSMQPKSFSDSDEDWQTVTYNYAYVVEPHARMRVYYGTVGTGDYTPFVADLHVCLLDMGSYTPPPPPSDYCLDGAELLENGVVLSPGIAWTESFTTTWPRLQVRYTFSDTMKNGSMLHHLDMRVNETRITRKFYSDEMQEWDPVNGWPDSAFYFNVPNTNDTSQRDYDAAAFETGPNVELYVAEGYNSINLLSVCVVPIQTSEFCEDGIEALTATPMYLSAAGGAWERRLESSELGELTHFVVRYRISHPAWPGTNPDDYTEILGKFMPQIQQNFYYVQSPITYGITFTLPITNALPLVEDYLFLRFYNRGDAVLLNSVCVIDATEEYLSQLSAENCKLNNPDFITAPNPATDWSVEGDVSHSALIGPNGGVGIDGGQVYQNPVIEAPNVWQMEVRASGGGDLIFGTQRPSLLDGSMQLKTEPLSPGYSLYRNNIYVTSQDWVAVQSDQASVDYVCLMQRAGIIDMPNCTTTKPVWNPEGSGDPLLIYLFKYIGEMIEWALCLLLSFLTLYFNSAMMRLEDLLLRIGPLPNPFGGNFWEELMLFFQLSFEGLLDYFDRAFLPGLSEFLRYITQQIIRWLSWQWRRVGQWLDWLLYDVIQWLSQQLGMPPQAIYDVLYELGYEARMFWVEIQTEIINELRNALQLLGNMANVLIVLASGVREGVSGNTIAYIGEDFSGIGAFIWDGVEFVNEAVDLTPLSALNIVALGVITYGLMGWTGKRFLRMLQAFS